MTRARVLVVEDEAVLRLSLEERLAERGYEVAGTADTAAGAVAEAERARPDLVLMDVRLRGPHDGVWAAAEIRRRFAIPSIFLTAFGDSDTMARAAVTEPLAYLLKPVPDRELTAALEVGLYRGRVERERREREALYAITLAGIADAVVAVDASGAVTFLNAAAEARTGWPVADALGLPVEEVLALTAPEPGACGEHPARAALAGAPARGAFALWDRAGRELAVEVRATPVRPVPHEPPTGAVLAVRDTVARERAAADERRRAVSDAVAALAGGVAFRFAELHTPLAGFVELLGELGGLSPKARELIGQLKVPLARGAALIRELQAASGARAPSTPTDVLALLRVARTDLRALVPAAIALDFDLPPEPAVVSGAPEHLLLLVRCLVANAAQACDGGGGVLVRARAEVRTAEQLSGLRGFDAPRPGPFVCVEVRDTGRGVPAGVADRLFVPFVSTKGPNRGLGLVIAEGVARAHRGALALEPLAPGTAARVWLPLIDRA